MWNNISKISFVVLVSACTWRIALSDSGGFADATFTVPSNAKPNHQILDVKKFKGKLKDPIFYEITYMEPYGFFDSKGKGLPGFTPERESDYRCGLNNCTNHYKCNFCLSSDGLFKTTQSFEGVTGQNYIVSFLMSELTKKKTKSFWRMDIRIVSACNHLDATFSSFRSKCSPQLQNLKAVKSSGFVTLLRFEINNVYARLLEVELKRNKMKGQPRSVMLSILGVEQGTGARKFIVQEQNITLEFLTTRARLSLVTRAHFSKLTLTLRTWNYVSIKYDAVILRTYDARTFCKASACLKEYEVVRAQYEAANCAAPYNAEFKECNAEIRVRNISEQRRKLGERLVVTCPVITLQHVTITWTFVDGDFEREIQEGEHSIKFEGTQIIFQSLGLMHAGHYTCIAKTTISKSSNPFPVIITDSFQYNFSILLRGREFRQNMAIRQSTIFTNLGNAISLSVGKVIAGKSGRKSYFRPRRFSNHTDGVLAEGTLLVQQIDNGETLLGVFKALSKALAKASMDSSFDGISSQEGDTLLTHRNICPEEVTRPVKGLTLSWPATIQSGTATIPCPFDAGNSLTRVCSLDAKQMAKWGSFDARPCRVPQSTSTVFMMTTSSSVYSAGTSTIIAPTSSYVSSSSKAASSSITSTTSFLPSTSVAAVTTTSSPTIQPQSKEDKEIEEILNLYNKKNLTNEEARNASQTLSKITAPSPRKTISPKGINDASLILNNLGRNVASDPEVREQCMNAIDNILQINPIEIARAQEEYNSSSRLLETIGSYGEMLAETGNKSFVASRKKFALGAVRESTVDYKGFVSSLSSKGGKVDLSLNGAGGVSQNSQSSIELPPSLVSEAGIKSTQLTIIFTAFPDTTLFQTKNTLKASQESPILAVQIRQHRIKGLSTPLAINILSGGDTSDLECGFWDVSQGQGLWSTEGCYKDKTEGKRVTCHCNHMTNFALLFGARISNLKEHRKALNILTYIGSGISLFGATITFITYLIHPKLRDSNPPKILMNLVCTLILFYGIFLAGIDHTDSEKACKAVAILLQYSFLAVFSWSLVEGFASFRGIVRPMAQEIRKFIFKAMIVGWGLPVILTAIGAGVWPDSYGSQESCVVRDTAFYVTVLGPVGLVLILNYCALAGIMCSLIQSARRYSHNSMSHRDRLRIIVAFILLFGLTWVFGLLVISNDVLAFQYIFCILSGLHGFFVFLFYCVRNENVRKAWADTLRPRKSEMYSTSTYDTKKSELHSESAT